MLSRSALHCSGSIMRSSPILYSHSTKRYSKGIPSYYARRQCHLRKMAFPMSGPQLRTRRAHRRLLPTPLSAGAPARSPHPRTRARIWPHHLPDSQLPRTTHSARSLQKTLYAGILSAAPSRAIGNHRRSSLTRQEGFGETV